VDHDGWIMMDVEMFNRCSAAARDVLFIRHFRFPAEV